MNRSYRYNDFKTLKSDYRTLLLALPKLPTPEALLEKIVDVCRDIMYQCDVLDKLHNEIPNFAQYNERWGELERDAHLLEQKTENCELRFLLLRQTLGTLYASPPILIATKKVSQAAWDSMLTAPQIYYDAEGRDHKLPLEEDTMEVIIDDQLKDVNKLYMTIRSMRATALNEERAIRETFQETLTKSISVLQIHSRRCRTK
uniref:DHC_N1 domain-containing protein n=1 Tax=Haemonchus contortus TaxID=6289 RepID=A0A7I4XWH3_HAECO